MARKRDVIVAVVIVAAFVFAFGLFGLMMTGMFAAGDGLELSFDGNVGVIEVFGVLDEPSGRPVIAQLEKWQDNSSIRAIVLHVNSPGGEVAISQEIYDAIGRAREYKPVVVSMAAVAASGGYYFACAADRIVANPGTLTGSIGVIIQFYTLGGLMDKVGVDIETVKSGDLKGVGALDREMTKKEELMLRAVVMDTYEQFVEVVAEGRGKDRDEVYTLADGSIYTGSQAFNLGLVDTLGGLHEAVQLAADLADLQGEPKIVRPYRRERVGLFDVLTGTLGRINENLEKTTSGPRLLYLYQ